MTYPLNVETPVDVTHTEAAITTPAMADPSDRSSPHSLRGRAASGAAWISVETATTQVMSLIIFTIMARFLSAREFGLVSLAFVVILSVKIVLLDQLATAVTRKPKADHRQYSTVFWISLSLGLLAFILLNGFSRIAGQIFMAPGLGIVIRAMSVILLVIASTRTQEQWLIRNFGFRVLAIRSIFGALIGGSVGILCAIQGFGVWSLVVQQVVTSILSMIFLWSTCPWQPKFEFCRQTAGEIAAYMRDVIGGSVMYVLNQNCDVVLVGVFFGPSSVGIYGIGKRLTVALHMIAASPINGVAIPILAEVQQDAERLRGLLLNAARIVLSVCGPVFIGAAALDHEIIVIAFGSKWIASITVFGWLSLGSLFLVILEYNNNLFSIKNRPSWTSRIAILYSAMALGLFFLMHRLHLGSIAMPFVLPYVVVLPISVFLVTKVTKVKIKDWLAAVTPPLISVLVMFLAVRLVVTHMTVPPVCRLVVGTALGGIIYLGLMTLLAPTTIGQAVNLAGSRFKRSFRSK